MIEILKIEVELILDDEFVEDEEKGMEKERV